MLKTFFGQKESMPDINSTLSIALDLEKDGYKEAALHLVTKLVKEHPECKSCRYHMGRLASEEWQGEKQNTASPH